VLFLLRYLDTLDTARDFSLSDPFEHKRKMASPPGAAEALEKLFGPKTKTWFQINLRIIFHVQATKPHQDPLLKLPCPGPEAVLSPDPPSLQRRPAS